MRPYLSAFLLALGLIGISSCDKDDGNYNARLEIRFIAIWDGEPLIMNSKAYDYFDSGEIRIKVSEFFLSHLTLSGGEGEIELFDIEYIRFTDNNVSETSAMNGISFKFDKLKTGTYDRVSMSIGVDDEMNATKPQDYSPDHPLAKGQNYWDSWNSFIFSKHEGILDSIPFIYHSGKNAEIEKLYYPFDKEIDLQLEGNKDGLLKIYIDHKKLFSKNDSCLDIAARPTDHSNGDLLYPRTILQNFQNAIHVE